MPVNPSLITTNKLQRALGRISRYTGPINNAMSTRFIQAIQTHLKSAGVYSGAISGNFSNETARGIQRFVKKIGAYTGNLDGVLTEEIWKSYLQGVRQINLANGHVDIPLPTFANTVAPAITGTAKVGQTLTVSNGTWGSVSPDSYKYQWKKAGVAIAGATNNTYVPVTGDIGSTITATVTAVEEAYADASATSAATSAVVA